MVFLCTGPVPVRLLAHLLSFIFLKLAMVFQVLKNMYCSFLVLHMYVWKHLLLNHKERTVFVSTFISLIGIGMNSSTIKPLPVPVYLPIFFLCQLINPLMHWLIDCFSWAGENSQCDQGSDSGGSLIDWLIVKERTSRVTRAANSGGSLIDWLLV